MSKKATAFIFARGGSKGVPGKNIRLLGGIPLIAHAIRIGLSCPSIGKVVVSTDSTDIANIARENGAEVPFMRPAELAEDKSPEWQAWQHAVRKVYGEDPDPSELFVSLPPTSPFRSVEDVEACVQLLRGNLFDLVLSVSPSRRNPYFNMVQLAPDREISLAITGQNFTRRQDAPATYDITTVCYATRPHYVLQAKTLLEGRVGAVIVPEERALDIDTEMDFQWAQFLMEKQPGGS